MLTDREYSTDQIQKEFVTVKIKFEGSPEGLTIGIENAKAFDIPLKSGGKFLVFINPWPYQDQSEEELKEMKELTQHFLEIFPNASIQIMDDGSWDFNPDSDMKVVKERYVGKGTDPNEWKNQFPD